VISGQITEKKYSDRELRPFCALR